MHISNYEVKKVLKLVFPDKACQNLSFENNLIQELGMG